MPSDKAAPTIHAKPAPSNHCNIIPLNRGHAGAKIPTGLPTGAAPTCRPGDYCQVWDASDERFDSWIKEPTLWFVQ